MATASLDDPVGGLRAAHGLVVVTSGDGRVLGTIHGDDLARLPAERLAGDAMRPGPATYRPDVAVTELTDRLAAAGVGHALVTTPEGRLIGLFVRAG